ncbi:hypothetical protein DFJ73DRAFT_757595 [Zopfochytrium polystomum]|nr:hypothetical protein DFJ73DRAFT_757595 [Zopfochytrium polystomum]
MPARGQLEEQQKQHHHHQQQNEEETQRRSGTLYYSRRRGPPASSASDDLASTLRSLGPSATPRDASLCDIQIAFPSGADRTVVHTHKAIALSNTPIAKWLSKCIDCDGQPHTAALLTARCTAVDRAILLQILAAAYSPTALTSRDSQSFRNVRITSSIDDDDDDGEDTQKEEPFTAHRFLLASRTEYFATLFTSSARWADSGNDSFAVPIENDALAATVAFTEDPATVAAALAGALPPARWQLISRVLAAADFLQFGALKTECVRQIYALCHGFRCDCSGCLDGGGAVFEAALVAERWRLDDVMEDARALMQERILTILPLHDFYTLVPFSIRKSLYQGLRKEYLTPRKIKHLVRFLDSFCPSSGRDFTSPLRLQEDDRSDRLPPASREPLVELDAAVTVFCQHNLTAFCQKHFFAVLNAAAAGSPRKLAKRPTSAQDDVEVLESVVRRALSMMTVHAAVANCALLEKLNAELEYFVGTLSEAKGERRARSPASDIDALRKVLGDGWVRCVRSIARRCANVDLEGLSPVAFRRVAELSGLTVEELNKIARKDADDRSNRTPPSTAPHARSSSAPAPPPSAPSASQLRARTATTLRVFKLLPPRGATATAGPWNREESSAGLGAADADVIAVGRSASARGDRFSVQLGVAEKAAAGVVA